MTAKKTAKKVSTKVTKTNKVEITVCWTPSLSDNVVTHNVFCRKVGDKKFVSIGATSDVSFDAKLVEGAYEFYIEAVTDKGETACSEIITVTCSKSKPFPVTEVVVGPKCEEEDVSGDLPNLPGEEGYVPPADRQPIDAEATEEKVTFEEGLSQMQKLLDQ